MPTLEFTLMVGCPLKCTFCPQDGLRTTYGKNAKYMSFDNFVAILHKVPRHVRIDFSGMAEPWANKDATSMLRHALEAGYSTVIYTTLYGMTRDDCVQVADLCRRHADQIEVLCLHLPDRNGNMRGWRYSPEYEANLLELISVGRSGGIGRFEVMTMDGGGTVHGDLDHLGIQLGSWTGHSRAGNVTPADVSGQKITGTPEHHGAVTCAFTAFYDQNVVLPNGDVVLCCMDYSLKHKLGNLLEEDYYEMFASGGLGRLMAENMTPRFSRASLCKTCERAQVHRVGPSKQFWQ